MNKFSIEHLENVIIKEYNVVELKSMYLLRYKGITKLAGINYIVRDVDDLNLDYDDYIDFNNDIDLFLNDEITLKELINRSYIDANVFMYKLKYMSDIEEQRKIVDINIVHDMVDQIDIKDDLRSIGFVLKGAILHGFCTNSMNPIYEIPRDYDHIIVFTDEINQYRNGLIDKDKLKIDLVNKLLESIYIKLFLIKNLK